MVRASPCKKITCQIYSLIRSLNLNTNCEDSILFTALSVKTLPFLRILPGWGACKPRVIQASFTSSVRSHRAVQNIITISNPDNNNPIFVSQLDESTASHADSIPNATTQFTNDGAVEYADMPHLPLSMDMFNSPDTGMTQDIKEFLMKPMVLQTGVLSTTDVSTTFATLEVLQSHIVLPLPAAKVSGFMGIKATHVLRLQVNGNRFQQGRYILFWIPFGGSGNTASQSNGSYELIRRRFNKTTVTQLPHVEIDINTTTEAVLEIPYISAYPYTTIGGSTHLSGCLGYVGIYPYSPLVAPTGSTTATYTLFSSLKDVDLVAPTVPQMAFGNKSGNSGSNTSVKMTNASEAEQRQAGVAPVSSGIKIFGKAVATLGEIPLLSSLAAPVSWGLNLIGNVAEAFGWSNPIDLTEVTRAVQTIQPYSNNCDMIDASMPVSLFGRNLVEVLPGFAGNDVDEMSIDYIKTIPAYLTSFTFTTTSTAGTQLYNLPINPYTWFNSVSDTGVSTITRTPISFLCALFNFWRGSVRITLKIVKTEFHSGRIEVVYVPQEPMGPNGVAPTTSSAANRPYLHREVIDIRMGNQVDLLIPYTSIAPYRNTVDSLATIGNIQVYSLNPLVAPASVSNSITFLVEVAAGEDFEVAQPRNHNIFPVIPTAPQMSFSTKKNDNAIITDVIGNSSSRASTHIEARTCIGEKIMSLNSLLKSADIVQVFPAPGGSGLNNISYDPYSIGIAYNNAGTVTGIENGASIDNYGVLGSCYVFSRGGVRVRTLLEGTLSDTLSPVVSTLVPVNSSTSTYEGYIASSTISYPTHSLAVRQNQIYRGGMEVQIPHYNATHSRVNVSQLYCLSGPVAIWYNALHTSRNQINFTWFDYNKSVVTRQIADDFQFGFFIGVPPSVNE